VTARCPDCCAVVVKRNLVHDQTCPLGRAMDALMDEDRDWFAAHPFATVRHRPATAAERTELCLLGYDDVARLPRVQVVQIRPGLRVRHPYGGGCIPHSAQQVERVRVRYGAVPDE